MKFCDGCGQELSSSSCGFCGKEETAGDAPLENQQKTSKFRWLRSDRPKRYLAEMTLVGLVVLISSFIVAPNLQTNPNASPETEELANVDEPSSDQSPGDASDWNYNEISRSVDADGNPSQGEYSFSQWLETWDYSFEDPIVQRDVNCRNSICVKETLRITFEPMSDFNLYSIKGEIRSTSGQRLTPAQSSFEIVEGDQDFVFEFSNESLTDLREYPGNIFFRLEFFDFKPDYRIRPENRILDLSESGEG